MSRRAISAFLLAFCLFLAAAYAQNGGKQKGKSHMLHGKVTEVGTSSLTVDHEKVEGYMDAMTMAYKVDKPEQLKNLKKGDMIMATVYDGDYTLYDIKVMPPAEKK
jgi:Cu/Ag efflux protein CusF